ncbi:hypothetical protein [Limoniibacter endophyticus]|uniref:Uncharacterized protein n=1 Tax=Limoniibacter endophyticus TaxID=1565040 RepID=A0A8J3DK31_9HYPH|nr:hypothetical protein [Limoniibacter endophyticus]GHC75234.1 hypothetical protein GCM10010136_24800 [Limoniibacter endophyticus]
MAKPDLEQDDDTASFEAIERAVSVPIFRDDIQTLGARLASVDLTNWMTSEGKSVRILMSGHGLSDYVAKAGSEKWYHIDETFGWYYMRILIGDQLVTGSAAGIIIKSGIGSPLSLTFEFYLAEHTGEQRPIPHRRRNRLCIATISDDDRFATSIVQFAMAVGPAPALDLAAFTLDETSPTETRWTIPASRLVTLSHEQDGIVILTRLLTTDTAEIEDEATADYAEQVEADEDLQEEADEPKHLSATEKKPMKRGRAPAPDDDTTTLAKDEDAKPQPKTTISNGAENKDRLKPKNATAIFNGRNFQGKAVVRVKWDEPLQTLGKNDDGLAIIADVIDELSDNQAPCLKMVNRADNVMVDGVTIKGGISKIRLQISETTADGKVTLGLSEVLVPMSKGGK